MRSSSQSATPDKFLAILGDPPRGEIVMEPKLSGPQSWGMLENAATIPEHTATVPYLYTHDTNIGVELEKAGMLGGRTYKTNHGGQELYKIRLKNELVDEYTKVLEQNGRPPLPIGYTERSFYPLPVRLKGSVTYLLTQVKKQPALIVKSTLASFDPLITELVQNGMLSKNGSEGPEVCMLPEKGWAVAFPITPALQTLLERASENQIRPFTDWLADSAPQPVQLPRNLSLQDQLKLLRTVITKDAANELVPSSNRLEKEDTSSPKLPSGATAAKETLRTLADDASLLSNVLIITKKRMADGKIHPFLEIDRSRLPRNMDWAVIRQWLLPIKGVYREKLPSLAKHAGGMIINEEDLGLLLTSFSPYPACVDNRVRPFEVHSTMRRRVENAKSRDYVTLLGGVVRHGGGQHHYLYVSYASSEARPFLPLGFQQPTLVITEPNERPRIERIEIPSLLWEDVTSQLNVTLLAEGADFISQDALHAAVRESFSVRTIQQGESRYVYRGRPRRGKTEGTAKPDTNGSRERDQDRAFKVASEIVSGMCPVSKDDLTYLLLGQHYFSLPDREAIKARESDARQKVEAYRRELLLQSLKDGERKEKLRAFRTKLNVEVKSQEVPCHDHPYFAIRGLSATLDRIQELLVEAGLLEYSVPAPAVSGDSVRLFILRHDPRSIQFYSGLRAASAIQSEFSGDVADKAGRLASNRFQELEAEYKQRQQDPIKNFVTHLSGRMLYEARVRQPLPEEIQKMSGAVGRYASFIAGVGIPDSQRLLTAFSNIIDPEMRLFIGKLPGMDAKVREWVRHIEALDGHAQSHTKLTDKIGLDLEYEGKWADQVKFDPVVTQWFIVNPSPYTREMLANPSIQALMRRSPQVYAEAGPQRSDVISIYPNPELRNLLRRQRHGQVSSLSTQKEIPFYGLFAALESCFRPKDTNEEEVYVPRELTLRERFNSQLEALHDRRAMLAYEKPKEPPALTKEQQEMLAKQRNYGLEAGSQLGSMPVLVISVERKQQFERLQQMIRDMHAQHTKTPAFLTQRFFGEGLMKKEITLPPGPAECVALYEENRRLDREINTRDEAIDYLNKALLEKDENRRQFFAIAFRNFVSKHPELRVQINEISDESGWYAISKRLRDQRTERIDEKEQNEAILNQKDPTHLDQADDYMRQSWVYVRPVEADAGPPLLYAMNGVPLESYEQLQQSKTDQGHMLVKLYLSKEMAKVVEEKYRQEPGDLLRDSRFLARQGPSPVCDPDDLAAIYRQQISNQRKR